MTINMSLPNQLILEALVQKSVLANIVLSQKSTEPGRRGSSTDVFVEYLEDVTAKTYTKADKDANNAYVYDQFSLTPITVKLINETYAALELDGWDQLDFNADNIQDLMPTINFLSSKIKNQVEGAVGTAINGLTGDDISTLELTGVTRAEKGREIVTALQEASLDLDGNGVATDDRYAVLGRESYLNVLATDELLHADKAGEVESKALRKAIVGEIAGFTVLTSDKVDSSAAVVFQREAFGLVSRAPGKHLGAVYSGLASVDEAPIELRVNIDGLAEQNSTGIIVSTFYTVEPLVVAGQSNPRAKKLVFTDLV